MNEITNSALQTARRCVAITEAKL